MNIERGALICACLLAACGEGGPVAESRAELSGNRETPGETGGSVQLAPVELPPDSGTPPEPSISRTLETCPHATQPSLVPIPPPAINRKNSARRVRLLKERIERIDVIEVSTYRVLFTISVPVVEAVRSTLAEPLLRWSPNTRTASLPAWPIALLFFVTGEPRPFLGWFFDDGDVYFVDESDPWNFSVFEDDGETFRDVFSIPTSLELSQVLSDRFGEYDPLDQFRRSAQRREDVRCGRVSQPHGETFPDLPRAIVERPNTDEPCFDLSLVAEDLKVLDLGKGAALRLRGGPYDFRHLVSDAPLNDEFRTFSFCGLVEGQRYDLTLERSEGAKPEVLSEAASLDSFIQGLGTPEYRPVPISIHMPRPPELREEDEDENSDE